MCKKYVDDGEETSLNKDLAGRGASRCLEEAFRSLDRVFGGGAAGNVAQLVKMLDAMHQARLLLSNA